MVCLRTVSCHYRWIVAIGILVLGHSLAGSGMAGRRKDAPTRIVDTVNVNALQAAIEDLVDSYYPSYASVYPDHLYGRSPLTDSQLARLSELVGTDLRNQRNITQLSFTRPERSLCLTQFANRHDPAYAEALAIIRAGAEILAQHPRPDMAGFQLLGNDVEREVKYESLWQAKKQSLQAILRDK